MQHGYWDFIQLQPRALLYSPQKLLNLTKHLLVLTSKYLNAGEKQLLRLKWKEPFWISQINIWDLCNFLQSSSTYPSDSKVWKPLGSMHLQFVRVTQWRLYHYTDQSTSTITVQSINQSIRSLAVIDGTIKREILGAGNLGLTSGWTDWAKLCWDIDSYSNC